MGNDETSPQWIILDPMSRRLRTAYHAEFNQDTPGWPIEGLNSETSEPNSIYSVEPMPWREYNEGRTDNESRIYNEGSKHYEGREYDETQPNTVMDSVLTPALDDTPMARALKNEISKITTREGHSPDIMDASIIACLLQRHDWLRMYADTDENYHIDIGDTANVPEDRNSNTMTIPVCPVLHTAKPGPLETEPTGYKLALNNTQWK